MADSCALCGRDRDATDRDAVEDYCSPGCRDVAATLGPADDPTPTTSDAPDDGFGVDTYLRVDGMYSATCEAYLESVAEGLDGVRRADASYVTETVRVRHDADEVTSESLRAALSRLGYTAYLRSEASPESAGRDGATRRSREMSGLRRRRDETILGLRYAAGVVFGSFLLVPYVTLLYPAYLAPFVDIWLIDRIGERLSLGGAGGVAFLRLYFIATAVVLAFTGLPLLRGAYTSLRMRRPTTDLLVAATVLAAFVYGTVAVLVGRVHVYFDMTLVVAALVTGAGYYRAAVKRRALERLTDLTVSQVDTARRYVDGETAEVPVEAVDPGDELLVRTGERVPVDGHLQEGACTVREAVVTGEALPVRKEAGDELVGGAVVTGSPAVMRAGADAASSLERLTTAVWDVQSASHGDERRADRHAVRAAPVVAAVAVLAGLAAGVLAGPVPGLLAALLAVIVASPWALGLAAPLSVAANLRDALAAGVVVFDETVFERLRDVDVVVFDKTGTLTTGAMDVVAVDVPADLRRATVALERRAAHPVARAVVDALDPDEPSDDPGTTDVAADGGLVDGVQDFVRHGTGVEGVVDGERVLVGTPSLFEAEGWTVEEGIADRAASAREFGQVPVVVGRAGVAEGLVVVGDEPRDGWDEVLDALSARGMDVVVLTGDHADATGFLADHDAVTDVFAGVPPEGKAAAVRRLAADRSVAMVGDGTNDALALAAADLGVSLGGGTALAADAADVAVLDDDLAGVETAFELAAGAERRVRQNTAAAISYNAAVVPLALLGLLNPLFAMVAVVLAAGAIGVNSARTLG